MRTSSTSPPRTTTQTTTATATTTNPFALVNAWEGALQDFKDSHPEHFLPPTESPRTLAQRKVKAPFWYGPPPSEASTSKLVSSTTATTAAPGVEQLQAVEVTYESYLIDAPVQGEQGGTEGEQDMDLEPDEEQPEEGANRKKRKRLTGSQKKARKAAKLGLTSTATTRNGGTGAGPVDEGEREAVEDGQPAERPREPSPKHVPQSPPTRQAAPVVEAESNSTPFPFSLPPTAASTPGATHRSDGKDIDPASQAQGPAAALVPPPPPPSAFRFVVPPLSSLPTRFPPPPAITPLTGNEPPLEPETPEQLLESALWSWYSAGYQTALYHAAVGVAKFAPSQQE
ncbi:hypothetical protein JCM3774_005859 [Rhodotorula dairenensis]